MGKLKINLSQAFAGQMVGVKQIEDRIWLVSFMQSDLGFFDNDGQLLRLRRKTANGRSENRQGPHGGSRCHSRSGRLAE